MKRSGFATLIERTLWALGAVLGATWMAMGLDARLYQARAERELATHASAATSAPTQAMAADVESSSPRARTPAASRPTGRPIGRLTIPRTGLEVVVAEGIDTRTLRRAVGHVPGTALPGEGRPVALAGHRDSYFKGLGAMRPGDPIRLETARGSYLYRVVRTAVVEPDRGDLLDQAGLTLVTCYPFHAIGSAPDRFLVQASQVSFVPRRRT